MTSSARTKPASPAAKAAVAKLLHAGLRLDGITLHVWSVRVASADPHFARAYVGLTGGPYGGGKGDTAYVVAMEIGGNWSVIAGPGTGFPEECHKPTVEVVRALLHQFCP
jgi:hypothetical protein